MCVCVAENKSLFWLEMFIEMISYKRYSQKQPEISAQISPVSFWSQYFFFHIEIKSRQLLNV